MRKSYRGIVEYSFSIYLLLLAAVMVLYVFRMEIMSAIRRQAEDALVSANLAAAVIDLQVYDEENFAIISDPEGAYEKFEKALKTNLGMDETMLPSNHDLFPGKISVEAFEIYNVYGDDVERIIFTEGGQICRTMIAEGRGSVLTPNGKTVDYTSIYSRIGFDIRGIFGGTFYVRKDNCVDIVAEFLEEEDEEEKNL